MQLHRCSKERIYVRTLRKKIHLLAVLTDTTDTTMSSKFSGFTEDDIKKLQKNVPVLQEARDIKNAKFSKKTPTKTVNKPKTSNVTNKTNDISDDARLSRPRSEEKPNQDKVLVQNEINTNGSDCNSNPQSKDASSVETIEKEEVVAPSFPIDLEKFQLEQKRMEEENRRRKEFLTTVLADRKKKTTVEAQRLEYVNEELKKLDNLLSNDVFILRNQIEDITIEYSLMQTRFQKLEKEYLSAKATLDQKREKKELLTQHLYTIIQQNELRKADKLSALMKELEITTDTMVNSNGIKE